MARRPQRAAKARDETAYQRRIREYKQRHPGATTQEARGKRAGEHIVRRERERAAGATDYEKRYARDIARKQAARIGDKASDPAEIVRRFELWARRVGHAEVVRFKAAIRAREKMKRSRVRVRRKVGGRVIRVEITGASSQVGSMQSDAGDFDLPDLPDDLPEWFWFFYH